MMHQIMALVAFLLADAVYCRPALEESDESGNKDEENHLGYGTIALRNVTIFVGVALLIILICIIGCVWSVFHDIKDREKQSLKLSGSTGNVSGLSGYTQVTDNSKLTNVQKPSPKGPTTKDAIDKPKKAVSPKAIINSPVVNRRGNQVGQIQTDEPKKTSSPNVDIKGLNQTSDGISIAINNTPVADAPGNQAVQIQQEQQQPVADDTTSMASTFSMYRPT